ncbi:MAG: hypothetical protein ACHP8B_07935 [Terriglobales bacterium]
MKYFLRILLLLSLISTFSMAQSTKQMSHSHQANAKFARMTDQFVKDSLALSPVSASQAGYHKHLDPKTGKTIDLDAQLDDVSAPAIAAQEKFYREWRHRFQTETPVADLNAQDAADYRLIDGQIALNPPKMLELEHIQELQAQSYGVRGADRQRAVSAVDAGVRVEGSSRRRRDLAHRPDPADVPEAPTGK